MPPVRPLARLAFPPVLTTREQLSRRGSSGWLPVPAAAEARNPFRVREQPSPTGFFLVFWLTPLEASRRPCSSRGSSVIPLRSQVTTARPFPWQRLLPRDLPCDRTRPGAFRRAPRTPGAKPHPGQAPRGGGPAVKKTNRVSEMNPEEACLVAIFIPQSLLLAF